MMLMFRGAPQYPLGRLAIDGTGFALWCFLRKCCLLRAGGDDWSCSDAAVCVCACVCAWVCDRGSPDEGIGARSDPCSCVVVRNSSLFSGALRSDGLCTRCCLSLPTIDVSLVEQL